MARLGRAKSFVFGVGRPGDTSKKAPRGAVVVVLWWSWWTGGGRKTAQFRLSSVSWCGGDFATAIAPMPGSFPGPIWPGNDGGIPYAGVIRSSAGTIYGTTTAGGPQNVGVVFRLDTTGHETVLHSFAGGEDGANPYAGLITDPQGNLYGTCLKGGSANAGVVFKLTPSGEETLLHSFTGGSDGGSRYAGLISDTEGNFYGTTYAGGVSGLGAIYKISPSSQLSVLFSFSRTTGIGPYAGLIRDDGGNLYGAASAQIFKLDTSGVYSVLYNFREGRVSPEPEGDLVVMLTEISTAQRNQFRKAALVVFTG